jgi:hypothetical protein
MKLLAARRWPLAIIVGCSLGYVLQSLPQAAQLTVFGVITGVLAYLIMLEVTRQER